VAAAIPFDTGELIAPRIEDSVRDFHHVEAFQHVEWPAQNFENKRNKKAGLAASPYRSPSRRRRCLARISHRFAGISGRHLFAQRIFRSSGKPKCISE
jgi:hypothetical protein